MAAISPVLPEVRADLDLSRGGAGLLTTLPVVCFGILAPVATLLGRRLGARVAVLLALMVLILGILVRSAGGVGLVVAGTALLGAGIAVGNVLVPALIKADLPHMAGIAMTLYTAALTTGATLAAGTTAPMVHKLGLSWRAALAMGALPVVVALVVWVPRMRAARASGARHAAPELGRRSPMPGRAGGSGDSVARVIWHSPIAWSLAVFMATQSLLFYSLLAWMPALLQERGLSANEAGAMLSLFNVLGILGALSVPALAARLRDQRLMAAITALGWLVGMIGLWLAPGLLLAVDDRARARAGRRDRDGDDADRAALGPRPGRARAVGHGADDRLSHGRGGPFVLGVLRDWSGGWSVSMAVLVGLCVVMTVAAVGAGRPRELG